MNPPRVYTCSQSWTPLPPPSPYHPSGSSQCTSPKHPVSCIKNLDWQFISYMILYMFQCHSPKSSPLPSPTESKRLFYTSVFLSLSRIQSYHYHLSRFHIYALVYCIGREGNGTPLQYSCLENPMDRGAWKAAVHGVAEGRTRLSDFNFTFHFHALEREMATHSSVLAWRIPGMGKLGGLLSLGSHRVGHDWSDLAAVGAAYCIAVFLSGLLHSV